MKTKEDILDEHFERGKIMQVKDEYIDDYGVHDFIYEAMTEYAQQQAIAFANWLVDNGHVGESIGGNGCLHKPVEQLHTQFIENQNTNQ